MKNRRISRQILKERLYRRRFLLPNAVTLGNMFCGFLAIVYAAGGQYQKAVISIGFAILLDGLDGRVARRFNATSEFGVEFDSFSDLISFGVAPALLVYYWAFKPFADQFGVFIAFVFALCAASRLARFNVSSEDLKKFVGLPTPGAAAMVGALVNAFPVVTPGLRVAVAAAAILLILAFLMVSTIEFFSVKTLRVRPMGGMRLMGVVVRVIIAGLIALTWYKPEIGFLVLSSAYCLSGPVTLLTKKPVPRATTPVPEQKPIS